MPGTYDDLWRIVLGALIGWLAFWLIDKFFRRDGEPADVDTVRALEGVDTLEAELKETVDERDALRNEAEAQRAESQRLAGLLENLRESNAEQGQKITNLQAALDAAREPARADGSGGSGGLMAGALAAGAGALAATAMARDDDRIDERRPADPGGATDETSAPLAAQLPEAAGTDDRHDTEAPADTLVTDSALVDDPALAIDDDELGIDDDEDWFAEDTDTFSMLDDLSDCFPEL
ncbi:MAG: hypothetical protein KDA89_25715, partial [Planctomycetaceae bacterium]|nr:hypothetical protein [Planctomycetaceae bacterium]